MNLDRRGFLAGGATALSALALPARAGEADPLAAIAAPRAPPRTWPAVSEAGARLGQRAILFEGAPWQGRPTRVFALVGMPASATGKVPAVVLAHGGGGTAFAEWVKRWNDAGFAAIAPALEGQTDVRVDEPAARGERWVRNPEGGPARDGIYGDGDRPLADQWMFHAQWAIASAHSLLAAVPGVDASRIGLCGISWGGIITATAMGIDPRIAFAVPIYGGGFLSEMTNQYRVTAGNATYLRIWEPGLRLSRAKMPSLWMTDLKDQHFSLVQQAKSYAAAGGPHMVSIHPTMTHNHPAAWTPPDSYAFARSVADTGRCWSVQKGSGVEAGQAWARFASAREIAGATLFVTRDRGHSRDRSWTEVQAKVTVADGVTRVAAPLAEGATAWFFVCDAEGLVMSSDLATSGPQ